MGARGSLRRTRNAWIMPAGAPRHEFFTGTEWTVICFEARTRLTGSASAIPVTTAAGAPVASRMRRRLISEPPKPGLSIQNTRFLRMPAGSERRVLPSSGATGAAVSSGFLDLMCVIMWQAKFLVGRINRLVRGLALPALQSLLVLDNPRVTARTAGTSFTAAVDARPTVGFEDRPRELQKKKHNLGVLLKRNVLSRWSPPDQCGAGNSCATRRARHQRTLAGVQFALLRGGVKQYAYRIFGEERHGPVGVSHYRLELSFVLRPVVKLANHKYVREPRIRFGELSENGDFATFNVKFNQNTLIAKRPVKVGKGDNSDDDRAGRMARRKHVRVCGSAIQETGSREFRRQSGGLDSRTDLIDFQVMPDDLDIGRERLDDHQLGFRPADVGIRREKPCIPSSVDYHVRQELSGYSVTVRDSYFKQALHIRRKIRNANSNLQTLDRKS